MNLFPIHKLPHSARIFPLPITLSGISNQPVQLTHAVTLEVMLDNKSFSVLFHLVPFTNLPTLLGNVFLRQQKGIVCFQTNTLSLSWLGHRPRESLNNVNRAVEVSTSFSTSTFNAKRVTFIAARTYSIPTRSVRLLPLLLPLKSQNAF